VVARSTNVPDGERVVELGDIPLLPGATISGVVRDAQGIAFEGARVNVWLSRGENSWNTAGAFAQSQADGSFAIEGVPTGWLRVGAGAPDSRASAPFELTVHAGEVRAGILLELPVYEDPFAISGVVYDLDGAALPEAPIQWEARHKLSSSAGSTRCGKDGRFRAQGTEGSVFRVSASHPRGEAGAVSRQDIPAGTHGIELRLVPQVTIPLRVRRPDGAFVEKFAYRVSVHLEHYVQGGQIVESSPESPGQAQLVVPADPFVVEVIAPGFATEKTPKLAPESLSASIDVVLRPLPALRGRVVRGEDPVAGARVRAHAALGRGAAAKFDAFDLAVRICAPCTEVATEADGSFVLPVGSEGSWHARVASDGDPSVISDAVLVVSGRGTAEILVDLGPRGSIEGRVRDANGKALARRTVAASCGDGSPVQAVTDADGAYRIAPLAPGGWQVRVLSPDRPGSSTSSFTEGPDDAPPMAWNCRVANGSVTTHDLVVAGP